MVTAPGVRRLAESNGRPAYDRTNHRFSSYGIASIVALLSACATQTTVPPPQARPASFFLEDPGRIVVFDDEDCEFSESGSAVVEGSFELPPYADSATVFLNGWRLLYLSGDHHVRRIEVEIKDVELAGSTLTWRARGFLADNNFNRDHAFCYTYTVVGWNGGLIDAVVDQNEFYFNTTSLSGRADALTLLPSFLELPPSMASKETVAILPVGFFLQVPGDDRHLLQAGTNLDHNESFLEEGKTYGGLDAPPIVADASRFDLNFTSWEYYGTFTDNDLSDDYTIIEDYAVIAGNDITMVKPPFMLRPTEDVGFPFTCIGEPFPPGVRSEDVEVRNLPFDYAVPALSGWELSYPCDDEHVSDIGIWLENIEYEKDPDEPTGVLRYRVNSILSDKDNDPSHAVRHKVDILGINGREPSDLIPRLGGSGPCPQIAVANIGADDAPPSTTRVRFEGEVIVDVTTPLLPKGFTYQLDQVDVPTGCFSDDTCSFEVTVDADGDVTETDDGNNTASSVCIG